MTLKPKLAIAAALLLAMGTPALADFDGCLSDLHAAARAGGIDEATFAAATRNIQFNPEVVTLSQTQPEFKTPIWDYIAGLVDDERVADGRAAMRQYAQAFAAAERRFDVDAPVIAAFWGVESNFGKQTGTRPVIQSLATLSCANWRAAYFRKEFVAALKILQAGDVDPRAFTGSWAGAFGHTQFMPSTFLSLAVDLDGDGHRDIVGSVPDALGSTANFMHRSHWVHGLPWGYEVRLPANYAGPSGRTNKQPMSAWAARGITRVDGALLGAGTAALLLPAGPNGPAFLTTHNFDAIFSYNPPAESYALAVALLSDRLRGKPGMVTPWPTDDPGLSRADRRELQALLIRRGYDLDGKTDGVIGNKTHAAIVDFQSRAGLQQSGRASLSVLTALRGR